MKILILTQSVNLKDTGLGFFHRWIEEFSKYCEHITVIGLGKGEYHLPKNITVLSLGKEEGVSRLKYVLRFYKYIWQERNNYDLVFVHMNQEYVLLGGIFWRLLNKRLLMWRNHLKGSFLTDIAVLLANEVFCTSVYSYTAKFKKTKLMPVGIDTDFFRRDLSIKKEPNTLLFLARISPVKKQDIFIESLNILNKEGLGFSAPIIGDTPSRDKEFEKTVRKMVEEYDLENKVWFKSGVSNLETVNLYNKYDIFINLTPSGSMDKTIFEAMACESLVLTPNQALRDLVDDLFVVDENTAIQIATKIKKLLQLTSEEKAEWGKKLRQFVIDNHSLAKLAKLLFNKR